MAEGARHAPSMTEKRSSNNLPEAIVHSRESRSLPEPCNAQVPAYSNLPEHYDAKYANDADLPEYYNPNVQEKANPFGDPDANPASEKQIANLSTFDVDDREATPVRNQRKILGLRPKAFYSCLAILLLVIVAIAIAAGVGASVASKKHSSTPVAANTDGDSPSATTSVAGSSATSTATGSAASSTESSSAAAKNTTAEIRSISATEVDTNILLTHQDDAGDLYYVPWYNAGGGWKASIKLKLDSDAAMNTSIASASWESGTSLGFRSYYIATSSIIQEIALTCPTNGTGCTSKSGALTGNIKASKNAGLAAVTTAKSTIRVFATADEGGINEIQYDPGAGWGSPSSVPNAQAAPTSPLAVAASGANMFLFWFTSAGELQFSEFTSSWSEPTTLETLSTIPASLTAALSQDPDVIQVLYPDDTGFQVVKRTSGTWASATDSGMPASSMKDGPIAVVGWNGTSTFRAYSVAGDAFQEFQPNGNGWETTTSWQTSYLGY